jgi:hypothetical protein
VQGAEDIGLKELEILTGLKTAIKEGDTSVDEAFPIVAKEQAPKDLLPKKDKKPDPAKPATDPLPIASIIDELVDEIGKLDEKKVLELRRKVKIDDAADLTQIAEHEQKLLLSLVRGEISKGKKPGQQELV